LTIKSISKHLVFDPNPFVPIRGTCVTSQNAPNFSREKAKHANLKPYCVVSEDSALTTLSTT